MHQFNPSIFREYDIRGTYDENLTDNDAYNIGLNYGASIKKGKVAVGFDGRISSPALSAELIRGITDAGINVVNVGLVPTGALYFAVFHLNLDGGIMITGSHNPPDQNGFKIMVGKESIYGAAIRALREVKGQRSKVKGAVESVDVKEEYIKKLILDLGSETLDLNIGYDPANGAAGEIIETLAPKISASYHVLNAKIDGTFPAHPADPAVEANLTQLKELVLEHKLDVGFAFDGDGDRVGVIDDKGRAIAGDQILAILATEVLAERPGSNIVVDVKTSKAVIDHIKKLGGNPVIWKCGHSLVKAMMKELNAPLAGEMSAHIFFADKYFGYDDGIYAAVRFLDVMQKTGRKASELFDELPKMHSSPEYKMKVDDEKKFQLIEKLKENTKPPYLSIDGMRKEYDFGWWLVRASNTGANIICRFEGDSEQAFNDVESELRAALKKIGLSF